MDEVVKEFLVESNENLNQLDRDLVELESAPDDRERLSAIFRTIHTIKGTCGFLAFSNLEKVAHAGESLLSRLRDGVLKLTPEITTALLAMVDAVREMLKEIEETGQEGQRDDAKLIERLQSLHSAQANTTRAPSPNHGLAAAPETPRQTTAAAPVPAPAPAEIQALVEQLVREQIEDALQRQRESDARQLDEIPASTAIASAKDSADAQQGQKDSAASGVVSGNIRVDVAQLDKLMNLIGELVLVRNQILQLGATRQDGIFLSTAQRLNLVTTELQEGIMKTRMQPISNVWNKFPRILRDLAMACGKQVELEMEGKETELDKTLIEAIKDPLTHVIRNSVDHGIESPESRVAAGKRATGRLLLRAFHEGGQVNIEVSDDGAGVDIERVKRKAVERGLISPQKAAQMSEREALELLFLPGFSTAKKVTNVSGRGVGMDVLRTNIEKIGGSTDIQSKFGSGTTIRIKIPLTLAIIPALLVTADGDRYAIPQVNLLELVRLEGEHARKGIEMVHGAPVYRLRGRLLPLVSLRSTLRLVPPEDSKTDGIGEGAVSIVVLQADEGQFGLIVDEISDTEEIVVKPLGNHLKGAATFAGATILGDGRVALILDVMALSQQAQLLGRSGAGKEASHELQKGEVGRSLARETLLVVLGADSERFAIPVSSISRLEEFKASAIERSSGRLVVQYRTRIMPLLSTSNVLMDRWPEADRFAFEDAKTNNANVFVVVLHAGQNGVVGLIVDQILDTVDISLEKTRRAFRPGTLGSAVIQGQVTELLDVEAIIRAAEPEHAVQEHVAEEHVAEEMVAA